MSRWQKITLAILGLFACCLVALVGWIITQNYTRYWDAPLGPALNLPTLPASSATMLSTSLAADTNSTASPPTESKIASLPSLTPLPTFTPFPTFTGLPAQPISCGNTQVMTILAIGTDARGDNYLYGLADVIRVVRVDFVNQRVAILEFPRDLWVEIPEISDNLKDGQDHERLNQAYLYGNPGFGYWDDPSAGPGLLARTLQLNFGIRPDHYVAVNMRTFEKIVNAVDGIDVYLPKSVDGRTKGDTRKTLYFAAGNHHLNGTEALQLARIRNEGTFGRAESQNRVLCALRDKLASPSVLPRIPEIVNSFTDNVQTDLSPEQIGQLACLGAQVSPEWILFASFPQELFKGTRVFDPVFNSRVFVWEVDFNLLRGYVTMFNLGSWPMPSLSAEEDDAESTPFCPPPGQ
jgi:LCP family protein required for cell wall assembly